jgi:hypothetical protein
VKVAGTGLGYASAAEARADADRIEELAADEAAYWREQGNEVRAEQASDRAHALTAKIRAAADAMPEPKGADVVDLDDRRANRRTERQVRDHGRREAKKPPARARSPKRSPSRARPAARTFTPRTSRTLRQTGIPAAGAGVTALGLQLAGLTIGVAALVLVLSRPRGVDALSSLFDGAAGLVRFVVEPTDPLAPLPAPKPAAWVAPPATPRRVLPPRRGGIAAPAAYGYGVGA